MEKLRLRNFRGSQVSSYDFSTLYTSLRHDLIKAKVLSVVNWCFNRESRTYLWTSVKAGFLAHLSQRLRWAIVIAHRPSSVRPSVVARRPSVRRKLSHFRLLLWNRWTEFNETWQEARSQRPLPSLCFSGRSEKQDGRPGLWLAETFSTSPLKPLNGIQRNLSGSKISTPSTKFVFFGLIGKTRWLPWPLIGWYIFNFSSETAERN